MQRNCGHAVLKNCYLSIYPLVQDKAVFCGANLLRLVLGNTQANKVTLGGCIQHRGSILASHPTATGLILGSPPKFFDVVEIYQLCWLEESGQRLVNVDQTHLVLASGKPSTTKN